MKRRFLNQINNIDANMNGFPLEEQILDQGIIRDCNLLILCLEQKVKAKKHELEEIKKQTAEMKQYFSEQVEEVLSSKIKSSIL
jgi:hypothetical protein